MVGKVWAGLDSSRGAVSTGLESSIGFGVEGGIGSVATTVSFVVGCIVSG